MFSRADRSRAVLIAVQTPRQSEEDVRASLAELDHLCEGLGIEVVHTSIQERPDTTSASLLGEGRLAELQTVPSDLVVVDVELSPGQLRHLEVALAREVLDRTDVILRVFEARARTRLARLEVELARLVHDAPRIRDDTSKEGRQGGGGRGGRGNTNAELARQRIRERVAVLRREAAALRESEGRLRARRMSAPLAALIGYTNAGKSSLMRALTGSEVLVEDKLFATLGTTVRALQPETVPRILVADTVGFIRNLSHALVASFHSTLEEARQAGLLLYVVDASDPALRTHLAVTRDAVRAIGAEGTPSLVLLNKADRLEEATRAALAAEFPEALLTSAHDPAAMGQLRQRLIDAFTAHGVAVRAHVPFTQGRLLAEVRTSARVVGESYDEGGVWLELEVAPDVLERLQRRGLEVLGEGRSDA